MSYGKDGAGVHFAYLYAWVKGEPVCLYSLQHNTFGYLYAAYAISLSEGDGKWVRTQGIERPDIPLSDYSLDDVYTVDINSVS